MDWTEEDCVSLALKNPHPLDAHVKFHAPSHAYAIFCPVRGWITRPDVVSVTAIVEAVKPVFDKLEASMRTVGKMMRLSREFASQSHESGDEYESAKLAKFGWYAPLYALNLSRGEWQERVLDLWDRNGRAAADDGTALHLDFERLLDHQPPLRDPSPEWDQVLKWIEDHPDVVPLRTEWRLCDPEHDLAGSADLFYTLRNDPPGTVRIFDLKRYKDVYDRGAGEEQRSKTARGPLAPLNLPWSTIMACRVQTGLYARMCEARYGLRVLSCSILSCHPNQPSYEFIELEPLPAHAIDLCLADRRVLSQKRRAEWLAARAPPPSLLPAIEPAPSSEVRLTREQMRARMRELVTSMGAATLL